MTSRSPGSSPYHHGALRETLIDVAVDLIGEKGVDGWSLREAARTIGVSPSAVYHHFRDRSALVVAVATRGFDGLGEQMRTELAAVEPSADDEPSAGLAALGRGYIDFALTNPDMFRVMFGPVTSYGENTIDPGVYDILQAELDRLTATGIIDADVRQTADFIVWSAVHGLALLLIDGQLNLGPMGDPRRAAELTAQTVLSGLRARSSTSR